jgi:UDP-N-acetylglucosamine transferase subunit ALG13
VTLGTIKYGFRRLLERLVAILPEGCEVVWQVGETDASGLGISSRRAIPHAELQAEMRTADVVVAHAGIGSALAALDAGKCPLLVPRERRHREHVDDHQRQIASALSGLGLAVAHDAAGITFDDLFDASRRTITPNPSASRIDLKAG